MFKVTVPFPTEKHLVGNYYMYGLAGEISKEKQNTLFFNVLSLNIKCHKDEQTLEDLAALWLETTNVQVVVAFWLCLLPSTAVFIASLAVDNLLALPAELMQTTT